MKIELAALRKLATKRPEGYYEDVVSRGRTDGDFLYIHPRDYQELRTKYAPGAALFTGFNAEPVRTSAPAKARYFSVTPSKGCGSCGGSK
jgi:hypothetical protein